MPWKYNDEPFDDLPDNILDGEWQRPKAYFRDGESWNYSALAALGWTWEPSPPETPDTSPYISMSSQIDREEAIAATSALIDGMEEGANKDALKNILTLIGG